jgi:hypothetical protein
MLKPIPAVTPPQTSRVYRQGCHRQVMSSYDERRRLSGRYDPSPRGLAGLHLSRC